MTTEGGQQVTDTARKLLPLKAGLLEAKKPKETVTVTLQIQMHVLFTYLLSSRSYDQARLYGPLGSSVSSVVSPTLSHRDADVPLHMRTGPRRTPLPISAFDERAPQMERGRPRLGQNYDLRRFNEHV